MEKAAKEALFRELYHLHDEDSEEEDSSNTGLILSRSKSLLCGSTHQARTPQKPPIRSTSSKQPSSRTGSKLQTTPHGRAGPLSSISFSSTVSQNQQKHREVESTGGVIEKAALTAVPTKMPKTNGKRKRGQFFEMKPESGQIFKGLSFFFIPNDDISPTRKFRIRKAMEFGALWVRQWREGITHIVTDKGICYQDILKFLKRSSLPANIILVNEIYPGDCLRYQFLVNPDQGYYQVQGHDSAPTTQHSSTAVASSEPLLQLKPGKGRDAQIQDSPSRTEASGQHSLSQPPDHEDGATASKSSDITLSGVPTHPKNPLDEAIEEAKAIQDLPLDPDDDDTPDDNHNIKETEGESSEDENNARSRAKKSSFNKSWQENFTCMSKHDGLGKSENPNARTIEILQRMADYYERTQDHWRFTAYRRAIGALRKEGRKITTAKEAFGIPFIGERLADKIEEIVWTNRLRRLENANLGSNDEVLQLFMKIYGVGLKQATKWIDQGYRTIDDLTSRASLSKNQRIGIEHLDDFQSRISRGEMDRHDWYVREFCSKIDPTFELTIGGSYRRGAADSGDVDFIVTKPDCPIDVLRTIMLETVIPRLFKEGYLKVGLATTAKEDGSKWHGAAALPGETVWRRIDFLLVPWKEIGAALIYFTGNDIFNRSIRLLASKMGMRLNQRGLWKDVMRCPNRERITQGSLVEGKDERKIFEHLGVPWRPPHHRIC